MLRDLHPGGARRHLSAEAAGALLGRVRPATAADAERKALARELLADLRRLDRALAANRERCARAVAASGTGLTDLFGVSEVLAAKILGHAGDVARFPTPGHFASYAGAAPVEASSGDVRRHRLDRAGNRALNTALHLVARCQLNHATAGRAHYERKLAEAKSTNEALRSLKCQLAKVVYRQLRRDQQRTGSAAGIVPPVPGTRSEAQRRRPKEPTATTAPPPHRHAHTARS